MHLAVAAIANVPGQNPFAIAERGRLGELAGTGNVALADVELVALGMPLRDARHRSPPDRLGSIQRPVYIQHAARTWAHRALQWRPDHNDPRVALALY